MNTKKYFCCDCCDEWSWKYLLRDVIPNAQFVEFNQPNMKQLFPQELAWLSEFRINSVADHKIYHSGQSHRFELKQPVEDWVLSKGLKYWPKAFLQDVSFFDAEGTELMATISHKRYIIKLLSEDERLQLKDKGIDFWCSWRSLEEVESTVKSRDRKSIFKSLIEIIEAFIN
ncbi:hypothetical protein LVD15_15235 [Fulvivirga maritima]|uniref:hypothetical protein n=1 Tax=Fulvivirga maritima TaxID=2904247 RepID=UPI001F1979FB|nr:hypothetical protein [Fulvivirga maritima]UII24667.1 hypothetical protein LVD15_15235 [Fulvivirga maritima]